MKEINLIKFKKLIVTVGNLPSSYVESLSYYECILWLCNFLENTVIPALNNNGEAVEELQGLYTELYNYVQESFDNLNLQTYVDNKLDEMVEDGTLQEIIAEYLNTQALFVYDTVEDMKEATNLIEGSYAKTLGYYEKEDGGNGIYKIRKITNEDIGNILIIPLETDDLVAELIYNNVLYSKQIGLKGDNTTDETTLLNKFYELETDVTKVLNQGIYLITDTLYIKGLWRQDGENTHNNGKVSFKFDKATIRYNGEADHCSIVFYNMFNQHVDGLSIDRTSASNYVDIIGCWHTDFNNFDISSLGIQKDNSILNGKTTSTTSVGHIKLTNGYINGDIVIDYGTTYSNGIYFDHVSVNSNNTKSYCCSLLGTLSKQDIVFNNCDLSYCSSAVFYVPEKQVGNITSSLGRCSLTCYSCYFDSNKPLFYNNNQNNITYNNYSSYLGSGNIEQIETIKVEDYIKNTVMSSNSFNGNFLPLFFVNCCNNGNLQKGGKLSSTYQIFGNDSTGVTKTVISDQGGNYGYAMQLDFTDYEGNRNLYFTSTNVPITGPYTLAVRLKKVSGSCNIQIGYNDQYNKYLNDIIPTGEDIILVNNKPMQISTKGSVIDAIFQVQNPNNLQLIVYECMIIPGRMVACGLPLHGSCTIPDPNA